MPTDFKKMYLFTTTLTPKEMKDPAFCAVANGLENHYEQTGQTFHLSAATSFFEVIGGCYRVMQEYFSFFQGPARGHKLAAAFLGDVFQVFVDAVETGKDARDGAITFGYASEVINAVDVVTVVKTVENKYKQIFTPEVSIPLLAAAYGFREVIDAYLKEHGPEENLGRLLFNDSFQVFVNAVQTYRSTREGIITVGEAATVVHAVAAAARDIEQRLKAFVAASSSSA